MNQAGITLGSPFGTTCAAIMPYHEVSHMLTEIRSKIRSIKENQLTATPFSRSTHQKQFASPIHHSEFFPRPDGLGSKARKPPKPQPCGGFPGCGNISGDWLARSGFAGARPARAKSGLQEYVFSDVVCKM